VTVTDVPVLGPATVLPAGVTGPRVVPEQVGLVHLGWGAFHRAHQAVATEDAMAATGDLRWGILGVAGMTRPSPVAAAARRQGGRYTVLSVGVGEDGARLASARVVGSVVDVASPRDETPRLLAALAAATTHVVTLTVTEKGYCRRPDGRLDGAQVADDVAALAAEEAAGQPRVPSGARPAATALGLLVRGLAVRRRAGGAPVTVLSCDNLPHNGRVLAGLVTELVEAALPGAAGAALRGWLAASVTFPSSMVDRITPATTPEALEAIAQAVGARDEAGVVAEPFSQWVIEDRFAGPRPAWERAGAELVDDVAPWEAAKLRMLNGTHSLLAYAGRLAGHATLADAVADARVAAHARAYLADDALPTLTPPVGADLAAYGAQLLRRFANPATGHTTAQVSSDGTQKIPVRWGAVAAWHLARGRVPQGVAHGLAAWAEFVRRAVRDGVDLGDPAGAARLAAAVGEAGPDDVAAVATALVALPGLLPDGAGTDARLVAAVVEHAEALAARGRRLH
jgi:fructuronate reductase